MRFIGVLLFSAAVGVSCGVAQNNNSQEASVTEQNSEGEQFGYLRNGDELPGVPFKLEKGLPLLAGTLCCQRICRSPRLEMTSSA